MARTKRTAADESTLEAALARAADRLIDDYKSVSVERSRLHDMQFDHGEEVERLAGDALYMMLVPMDDVVSIAGLLACQTSDADRKRYADKLGDSPLTGQDALISWTRTEARCPQVASLIQRTNDLRLILLAVLSAAPASRRSA